MYGVDEGVGETEGVSGDDVDAPEERLGESEPGVGEPPPPPPLLLVGTGDTEAVGTDERVMDRDAVGVTLENATTGCGTLPTTRSHGIQLAGRAMTATMPSAPGKLAP